MGSTRRDLKKELPNPAGHPRYSATCPFANFRMLSQSISALRSGAEPWQSLVKILPHMSHELSIRGMIGRLNANDNWIERWNMLLHIP